jgi:hypothetical protein
VIGQDDINFMLGYLDDVADFLDIQKVNSESPVDAQIYREVHNKVYGENALQGVTGFLLNADIEFMSCGFRWHTYLEERCVYFRLRDVESYILKNIITHNEFDIMVRDTILPQDITTIMSFDLEDGYEFAYTMQMYSAYMLDTQEKDFN